MTTPVEEPTAFDFTQLLDFDGNATGAQQTLCSDLPQATDRIGARCPAHGDEDCLCHGFLGDFNTEQQVSHSAHTPGPAAGVDEPDYSNFENWIPRFVWPEKPCDYCRTRRLNCFTSRGEVGCKPCQSLFRECSFANTLTLEAVNQTQGATSGLLDTLHSVDEDTVRDFGTLTGIKPLASRGISGTSTPPIRDDAPGSSKRNGIRFPKHAVKILRDWLDAHADHPYPSEAEKADLEQRTELRPTQIANWLANARRRRKVTEKARPRLCSSPSLNPTTPAISIPAPAAADKPWDELNPFERWQHSPPENEPAAITDIANAVAHTELPAESVSRSPSSTGRKKRSSNGSGFSSFRAPSTTSLDTSRQSSSISSTAQSRGSSHSHGSFGSFSSSLAGKREKRRRRRTGAAAKPTSDDRRRAFQCTFCTDTFKSKYDWTRHEKSLHLSLEKFICAPLGPVISDPETNRKKCVYCEQLDPSEDHLEAHNHRQCEDKGIDARTFYRKDHLRQHLRLMHGCELLPSMDAWKFTAVKINSRCGFCAQRFTIWQERVDHLTAHFKAGARMTEWKGCRGLDPAVAAQVTNAMPPYLIGMEATSPNPFSATNRATWGQNIANEDVHPSQPAPEPSSDSRATCWEILTVRLGKYANEMAQAGVVLTDEMLQQQARRIIYDSDDTWNQTSADNPEWLDLFKKAHGLDYIPSTIGGAGYQVPEDLETYGDLGLRIPFSIQLQAYNHSQAAEAQGACAAEPATVYDPAEGYVENQYLERLNAERARRQSLNETASRNNDPASARGLDPFPAQTGMHVEKCNPEAQRFQGKGTYLQRHKMELPHDRARRFATITGPWKDAGTMPEPMLTTPALHRAANHSSFGFPMDYTKATSDGTSTGEQTSSRNSLVQFGEGGFNLDLTTQVESDQMLKDLDDLIAATSGGQPSAMTAEAAPPAADSLDTSWMMEDEMLQPYAGGETSADSAMDDLNFDDITFGGELDTGSGFDRNVMQGSRI